MAASAPPYMQIAQNPLDQQATGYHPPQPGVPEAGYPQPPPPPYSVNQPAYPTGPLGQVQGYDQQKAPAGYPPQPGYTHTLPGTATETPAVCQYCNKNSMWQLETANQITLDQLSVSINY